MATKFQSAETFIELVRKCSAAKLDEALIKQSNDNWTVLHMVAHNQSAEVFIELVRKCSAAKLDEALVKQAMKSGLLCTWWHVINQQKLL